jgi:hypothetical protein
VRENFCYIINLRQICFCGVTTNNHVIVHLKHVSWEYTKFESEYCHAQGVKLPPLVSFGDKHVFFSIVPFIGLAGDKNQNTKHQINVKQKERKTSSLFCLKQKQKN